VKTKSTRFLIAFWFLFAGCLAVGVGVGLNHVVTLADDANPILWIVKTSIAAFVGINITCPIWVYFFHGKVIELPRRELKEVTR
jgi:hypothetical protein